MNYEAKVRLTSSRSVQNALAPDWTMKQKYASHLLSTVMNALSTELWSRSTPHLPALCECSINWTVKQEYASHPRSTVMKALSTELWSKSTSHILALCHVNALSTELWSKSTPAHILALCRECCINWTMKQKYRSHPRSLWWMFYQLNYGAKVSLISSLHCDECSINWTIKQQYASHPRLSVKNALSTELWSKSTPHILAPLWWMLYQLNYKAKVSVFFLNLCDECFINWSIKQTVHSTSLPCANFLFYKRPAYRSALLWLTYSFVSPSTSQDADQRAYLSLGIAWAGVTNPWGLSNFPS